jgi:TonB family protein
MRVSLAAAALILIAALSALAADVNPTMVDQVVVDRSTRSKIVNDYVLLTRDAIQRAWTTPVDMPSATALKGRVAITYVVTRSGQLVGVELVQGSGNEEMDRTLVEAIHRAAPYPPFPEELGARQLVIRAKFVVADLPVTPVTTVDMSVIDRKQAPESMEEPTPKKFKWGTPAEASHPKLVTPAEASASHPKLVTPSAPGEVPSAPPSHRYRWGLEP